MPGCPAFCHSGNVMKIRWMPELVRYRNKGTHSGNRLLRYRTEIKDARMPMLNKPIFYFEKPSTDFNKFDRRSNVIVAIFYHRTT
jgi:hypothetical protein